MLTIQRQSRAALGMRGTKVIEVAPVLAAAEATTRLIATPITLLVSDPAEFIVDHVARRFRADLIRELLWRWIANSWWPA